jgi:uncharacterized protein (DUF1501 family)
MADPRRTLSRRRLLQGAAAGAGALALPRPARAAVAPEDRKFIFVVNYGGWDPTRVFAPAFDNPAVDMEYNAAAVTAGTLEYVGSPERPSVRAFFEDHWDRSVILNGLLVPSVAHDACLRLALTGRGAQDGADWAAIIGGEAAERFTLPAVALAGPSYPGIYGASVTSLGQTNQLVGLLTGDLLSRSDERVRRLDWRAESTIDAYLARRGPAWRDAGAGQSARREALGEAYALSIERTRTLKDLLFSVDWSGGATFAASAGVAVDLLRLGLSRCATMMYLGNAWDTHQANDGAQSQNFELLFGELVALMDLLEATPGEAGGTLADETVVVVLSEMGRTPKLNADLGKDHWPVTSALLVGPGLAGGRVIGAFDELFYGAPVDLDTGEVDEAMGATLSCDVLGGTLLTLAGLDPELIQSGTQVLSAALE